MVQGVPHFTKAEDQYGPYRIPAGSIVLPNAFAITRDEAAFGPDTDAFIPERWMADVPEGVEHKIDAGGRDTTVVKDLPQTGFGFGRRICTGRHIATSQLFIQMARLLWAFDFEAAVDPATGKPYELDPMDISEGFVACPRPFRVVIRPRGQWARDLIVAGGDTDSFDYFSVLDEAAEKLHV